MLLYIAEKRWEDDLRIFNGIHNKLLSFTHEEVNLEGLLLFQQRSVYLDCNYTSSGPNVRVHRKVATLVSSAVIDRRVYVHSHHKAIMWILLPQHILFSLVMNEQISLFCVHSYSHVQYV